jgi:serine/threonine protein kinase/tetratricopeptide (TPR) repeat protein
VPTVDYRSAGEVSPPNSADLAPTPAPTINFVPVVEPPPLELAPRNTLEAVKSETTDETFPTLDFGPSATVAAPMRELPQVPGYEILDELGRGGMGVVYRARQLSLKRLVALKMIRAADTAGVEELARFRTEAEAVAHLHHANIVQIYEIGDQQGRAFFSLEFVDGGSLAGHLEKQSLSAVESAHLVEILARAVQHAHQRGVIHRDLKPANILLMEDGTPKITDFGLAKRLQEQEVAQTRSGAIMGTPSYMAPEQAMGKSREIGPSVDVYALGAILYELLTGRPPFRGETVMATLQQVIHDEPVPPSKHQPKLARDLETICIKALAKTPAQRYASALALAQDLERYQAGEPILARRESLMRRLARKGRRHVAAAVTGVVLLLLTLAAILALLNAGTTRQVSDLRTQIETDLDGGNWSDEQRDRLENMLAELEQRDNAQAGVLRQRLYERFAQKIQDGLRAARLLPDDIAALKEDIAWLAGRDGPQAALLRDRLRERLVQWQEVFDLREPFAGLAEVFAPEKVAVKGQHLTPVPLPVVGDAAEFALVPTRASSRGAIQLEADFDPSWQEANAIGLALNHQPPHRGTVGVVAFSPDGRHVYSAGADGGVRVWEVATGREILMLGDRNEGVNSLAVSPDGKILAASLYDGWITLWDAATGKKLAAVNQGGVRCLAFSADGKRLASGSGNKSVAIWEMPSLKQLALLTDHPEPIRTLAFDPDTHTLTAVTEQRSVVVWDLATGKPRSRRADTLKTTGHSCALSSDARTFALAGSERSLLCDPATGTEKGNLSFQQEPALLTVAPNGRRFAAVNDKTLHVVFQADRADDKGHLLDERADITALAFAPSGDLLAVGLRNGQVIVWDVLQRTIRWRQGNQGYVFLLASNLTENTAKTGQEPVPDSTRPSRPASFAAARARGVPFEMRLLRNGVLLHKKPLRLSSGPLHLLARRVGDRLEFQAGGESLVFHDAVPLTSAASAVFGVSWPTTTGLSRLRATAQTLPPAPSSLEQADDFFENGRYGEALTLYQRQFADAASPALKQEAQYQAGMCLVRLRRAEEAAQLFAPLVSAEGDRWPLLAACQLWMLHIQQKKFDDLDTLLTTLSARFNREQLAAYVPTHLRQDTVNSAQVNMSNHILLDPAILRRAEQALAIARFFEENTQVYWGRYHLAQLYCSAGQEDKALPLLRECVRESETLLLSEGRMNYELVWSLRWYNWLLRRRGESAEALRQVDRCLFDETGRPRWTALGDGQTTQTVDDGRLQPFLALYLERARTHAALGQWQRAEADLDEIARLLPHSTSYQLYASHLLMKGILCDRRGDAEGAKRAWRQGTHAAYLKWLPKEMRSQAQPIGSAAAKEALLNHLIMASLCDELPDSEAEKLFQKVIQMLGGNAFVVQIAQTIKLQPSVLREMWRSPRGREVARRLAFLDLSPQEFVRFPLYLAAEQKFKQDLLVGEASAEVEENLWQITSALSEGFFSGRISKTQALQISLAYKGTTNFLGWQGVAPTLEPSQRSKLAYLLGLRYTRLNRAREAEMFFRTAVADAPADSLLRRLAETERQRAAPKK